MSFHDLPVFYERKMIIYLIDTELGIMCPVDSRDSMTVSLHGHVSYLSPVLRLWTEDKDVGSLKVVWVRLVGIPAS